MNNMKMSRRKFFAFGAAAPLAAKQAVNEMAAQQAGITGVGMANHYSGGIEPQDCAVDANRGRKALEWIRDNGVPEWKEKELRESARRSATALEPDIASMVSLSLSAKIDMQAERHYQKAKANLITPRHDNEMREQFYQKFGWWL